MRGTNYWHVPILRPNLRGGPSIIDGTFDGAAQIPRGVLRRGATGGRQKFAGRAIKHRWRFSWCDPKSAGHFSRCAAGGRRNFTGRAIEYRWRFQGVAKNPRGVFAGAPPAGGGILRGAQSNIDGTSGGLTINLRGIFHGAPPAGRRNFAGRAIEYVRDNLSIVHEDAAEGCA